MLPAALALPALFPKKPGSIGAAASGSSIPQRASVKKHHMTPDYEGLKDDIRALQLTSSASPNPYEGIPTDSRSLVDRTRSALGLENTNENNRNIYEILNTSDIREVNNALSYGDRNKEKLLEIQEFKEFMTSVNARTAPSSPKGGRRTKHRRHKKRSTQKKTKGRRRKSRRNR
jgi:hypothetical protein